MKFHASLSSLIPRCALWDVRDETSEGVLWRNEEMTLARGAVTLLFMSSWIAKVGHKSAALSMGSDVCAALQPLHYHLPHTHFDVDAALLHILASCRPRREKLLKVYHDINIFLWWGSLLPPSRWVSQSLLNPMFELNQDTGPSDESGRGTSGLWAQNMRTCTQTPSHDEVRC